MTTDNTGSRFSCDGCKRTYAWKPELANRKVKCKCGATMVVPDLSVKPKAAASDENSDDFSAYDFAEPDPPKVAPKPAPLRASTPVMSGNSTSSKALSYERAPSAKQQEVVDEDARYVRRTSVIYPSIFMALGLLGMIGWTIYELQADLTGVGVITAFVVVKTTVKTALLVLGTIMVASSAGVSFGGFWSTVFKLAAMVIFADAVLMWVDTWIESLGSADGFSRRGRSMVFTLKLLLIAAIMAIQLKMMFDIDGEELGGVAFGLAFANRVLEFVFMLLLLKLMPD
jgi:hypothetical protein